MNLIRPHQYAQAFTIEIGIDSSNKLD